MSLVTIGLKLTLHAARQVFFSRQSKGSETAQNNHQIGGNISAAGVS